MKEQIKTINHNVFHFNKHIKSEILRVGIIRNEIAQCFLTKYKIKSISDVNRLVPNKNIQLKTIFRIYKGTYISDFIDKVNELDIILGKQLKEIHFSEFCDMDLIEKLGYVSNLEAPASIYLKSLKMDVSLCRHSSHISYKCDNRLYVINLFTEMHNILRNLSKGDDVVLTGCLFLTRLEVGLLYLFMSCFISIDHFENGVILLKNCNGNVTKLQEHFDKISDSISVITKTPYDLTLSVLGVVPASFLYDGAFQKELKYYNRTTINVGLRENDFMIV